MTEANQSLVERALQSFEMKDMESLMGYFADDALFFDPHYPEPALQGKTAIQQGFEFAFGMLRQPGFTIRHFWATERDGAVEVDTHHIFQDGNEVRFPQVFAFEVQDGLITRLQVYTPYPPPVQP